MRVSREEKDRSYEKIVESASGMLRERGVEATSVAAVMSAAGMTHGGFYRHFDSKEELLTAGLTSAFDEVISMIERKIAGDGASEGVDGYCALYLSREHAANPAIGCPAAALAGDMRHASESLREAFGGGVQRIIAALEAGMKGPMKDRRAKATREFAMLAGAVMLARASDPKTAKTILAACRD
jgi:TetR/AcrR family transcriptional regulator, transcriptional repressor for nem operon